MTNPEKFELFESDVWPVADDDDDFWGGWETDDAEAYPRADREGDETQRS
jgi:hypothetical protein